MTSDTTIVLRYEFHSASLTVVDAIIVRSDQTIPSWLLDANPGGWHPVEWRELIDGSLGPWAMVVEDLCVLSIAHTPKAMTEQEAECGVWTDPTARGMGLATAAATAWACILRSSGRRLIYSTTEDNLSSQRVAERLQLRLLSRNEQRRETGGSTLHPLCSVRENGD